MSFISFSSLISLARVANAVLNRVKKWISSLVCSRNWYWKFDLIKNCKNAQGKTLQGLAEYNYLGKNNYQEVLNWATTKGHTGMENIQGLTERMKRPCRTPTEFNKDLINAKPNSRWPAFLTMIKIWNCPNTLSTKLSFNGFFTIRGNNYFNQMSHFRDWWVLSQIL